MKILLAITFVFGILQYIGNTKLFDINPVHRINEVLRDKANHGLDSGLKYIFNLFGNWFYYFSLIFQAWYWLFK